MWRTAHRRRRGQGTIECLVLLVVATTAIAAWHSLGASFARRIAGSSATRAQPVAVSAQAGGLSVVEAVADAATATERLRIPTLARKLRNMPFARWTDTLEMIEDTADWEPEAARMLRPMYGMRPAAMDWLRDVVDVAGRQGIADFYQVESPMGRPVPPAAALAHAFGAMVPWSEEVATMRPQDYAQYFRTARALLAADGITVPDVMRRKLSVLHRIFHGGVSPTTVRRTYGANVEATRPSHFLSEHAISRHLPAPGSAEWNRYVELVRNGLTKKGYVILPLGHLFPGDLAARLRRTYRPWNQVQVDAGTNSIAVIDRRRSSTFEPYPEEMAAAKGFVQWQQDLIQAALPEDHWSAGVVLAAVRREGAETLLRPSRRDLPNSAYGHHDDVYIATLMAFDGPGPWLYPQAHKEQINETRRTRMKPLQVATGELAIFTGLFAKNSLALQGVPALYHGSPIRGAARTVIGSSITTSPPLAGGTSPAAN